MKRPSPPSLALGSDGAVYLDVAALSPATRRALRGRVRFVGVRLEGAELHLIDEAARSASFGAALAVARLLAGRK